MAGRIQQVAANITAVGSATPWIKHDYYENPFCVTLAAYLDSALEATLEVQYAADDQSNTSTRSVRVVQTASTTATITDYGSYTVNGAPSNQSWGGPFGHGLLTGDVAFLAGTQAGIDSGPAGYVVTVTSPTTYTVVTPLNQTIATQGQVTSARVLVHPTLADLTVRAIGSYAYPVWMSRLVCTAFTSAGIAYLVALQGR